MQSCNLLFRRIFLSTAFFCSQELFIPNPKLIHKITMLSSCNLIVFVGKLASTTWMTTTDRTGKMSRYYGHADVSQSMLVQDMGNNLSRLSVAKEIITGLLKKEPQANRWIGIFAGEAQGVLPLTHDINLVSTFLAWLDHQNLTKQWTSLAEAITLWAERFNTETTGWNILLVLSDGGEESVTIPETTIKTLSDREISVVLVGVWSPEWWPIIEWVDIFGNALVKKRQGTPVISKLQETQLQDVAKKLQWKYIRVWSPIVDQLHREIQSIPPKEQPGITSTQSKTLTPLFVFLWLISVLVAITADHIILLGNKKFF